MVLYLNKFVKKFTWSIRKGAIYWEYIKNSIVMLTEVCCIKHFLISLSQVYDVIMGLEVY